MKFDYEEINERLHPVISGILAGPSKSEDLTFIVDTGFEGNILIPSRLYKKLGFHKYENPASDFPTLETVSGMIIKIRSAPAKLCIENLEMTIDVWTMSDFNELLLGLDILDKLSIKLNGPDRILEILKLKRM